MTIAVGGIDHAVGEEFGKNIKDSAGFKRRRIVSMMVANVSTLGRT